MFTLLYILYFLKIFIYFDFLIRICEILHKKELLWWSEDEMLVVSNVFFFVNNKNKIWVFIILKNCTQIFILKV